MPPRAAKRWHKGIFFFYLVRKLSYELKCKIIYISCGFCNLYLRDLKIGGLVLNAAGLCKVRLTIECWSPAILN